MKLSKTGWIFLAVGIFLIVGISLIMSRSQQTDRQNKLQADLVQANLKLAAMKLDELIIQKSNLISQIADYEAQTEETKAIFTSSKDSIDTTAAILEEAQNQGVEITALNSPGVNNELLEGIKCEVLPLSIRIRGSIQRAADFVRALSQVFPTSVIKSIQLNIRETEPSPTPPPTPAENLPSDQAPGNTTGASAVPEEQPLQDTNITINLVIYNYKGK